MFIKAMRIKLYRNKSNLYKNNVPKISKYNTTVKYNVWRIIYPSSVRNRKIETLKFIKYTPLFSKKNVPFQISTNITNLLYKHIFIEKKLNFKWDNFLKHGEYSAILNRYNTS